MQQLVQHYQGPIVYLSSTAKYGERVMVRDKATLIQLAHQYNRTNLHTINGRRYIPDLHQQECGSPNHTHVADCAPELPSHEHRCMGDKGGEPDLVAFDLVQLLWRIVS